jgi:subtilisin-like proprotein convertase family protein
MPQVVLGHKGDAPVTLKSSEELIAVRTRSRRSLQAGAVQPAAAREISDGKLVLAFPEAGVEVYEIDAGARRRSLEQRKAALLRHSDVRFAGRVLVDEAGQPVLYTENLFVKFVDAADPEACRQVIREAGLTLRRELEYAKNSFFVSAAEGTGQEVFEIAKRLLQRPDVEYCHPELVRRRAPRAIFAQQWHLQNATVNGQAVRAHANVAAALATSKGEGITIAIVDDGFDIDHPEFAVAGKIVSPRDATFPLDHAQALNPRPKDAHPQYPDDHGTACAGVACAAGVEGASGVAPRAKLMPIRLAAGLGSQQEADAFMWAAQHGADVISCSWGPPDGDWWDKDDAQHRARVQMPASTKLAIDYVTTHGRGGKGCIVLFAAGNGNESVDNDGYASYEKVIAVAACNDRGTRSVYSDYGKAVWCSFPSSDFDWPEQDIPAPLTPGIWTTDRVSKRGYNPGAVFDGDAKGNYTNSFGGTSSACPGAAGVVALVLAVNPELKWLEVKQLLKKSCDKIDPQNGKYDATSAHSVYYGFGRLNAMTAVSLAQPARTDSLIVSRKYNRRLPDMQQIEVRLDVGETAKVDQLAVHVDLVHTYVGDLVLTLIPPASLAQKPVVLQERIGGSADNLKRVFDASSCPPLAAFHDTVCAGRWTLRVQDRALADIGTLVTFGLELKFAGAPAPRVASAEHLAALSGVSPENGLRAPT